MILFYHKVLKTVATKRENWTFWSDWLLWRQICKSDPQMNIEDLCSELPACRRLLFPLLHAEKFLCSACNKGNRRRLHAGNAVRQIRTLLQNCNCSDRLLSWGWNFTAKLQYLETVAVTSCCSKLRKLMLQNFAIKIANLCSHCLSAQLGISL